MLRHHQTFMSIKSFVQHSGWQEMVSLCSLIRLIGVCADRDQPEFLCSGLDSRFLGDHVATAGGCQRLLTHYRRRDVRNSMYQYRRIHIDYRSKFSYRFISSISIIYGNTSYHEHTLWHALFKRHRSNFLQRNYMWNYLLVPLCGPYLIQGVCGGPHSHSNVVKPHIIGWALVRGSWLGIGGKITDIPQMFISWKVASNKKDERQVSFISTHYGLLMPYGHIDLGQHWLR